MCAVEEWYAKGVAKVAVAPWPVPFSVEALKTRHVGTKVEVMKHRSEASVGALALLFWADSV